MHVAETGTSKKKTSKCFAPIKAKTLLSKPKHCMWGGGGIKCVCLGFGEIEAIIRVLPNLECSTTYRK